MSKKVKVFLINWMIWIGLLIGLSYPEKIIPKIQTANVLIEQTVKVEDRNGYITEIYVPSGSIVLAPQYFDKLSDNLALKDKLLSQGNVVRPTENSWPKLEKKIYTDASYGVKSGGDIVIGGRLDLML